MKSAEIIKDEFLIALVLECTTGENAEPYLPSHPVIQAVLAFQSLQDLPERGRKTILIIFLNLSNINITNFTEGVKEQGFLDMTRSVHMLKENDSLIRANQRFYTFSESVSFLWNLIASKRAGRHVVTRTHDRVTMWVWIKELDSTIDHVFSSARSPFE